MYCPSSLSLGSAQAGQWLPLLSVCMFRILQKGNMRHIIQAQNGQEEHIWKNNYVADECHLRSCIFYGVPSKTVYTYNTTDLHNPVPLSQGLLCSVSNNAKLQCQATGLSLTLGERFIHFRRDGLDCEPP